MQPTDIAIGIGLLLLVEGLPPFLSPPRYRALLRQIDTIPDRALRAAGLVAMSAGMVLLYWVR